MLNEVMFRLRINRLIFGILSLEWLEVKIWSFFCIWFFGIVYWVRFFFRRFMIRFVLLYNFDDLIDFGDEFSFGVLDVEF